MSLDPISVDRFRALAISTTILALSGCMGVLTNNVERAVDANFARSSELASQMKQGRVRVASESHSAVERVEGIWLPFKRLSEVSKKASAKEAASRRITISREFRNIQEVAERVTLLTGIPVKVAPDALTPLPGADLTEKSTSSAPNASGPGANLPIPALPSITGRRPNEVSEPYAILPAPAVASGLIALSYDGTLAGFLDVASARFGVSWEWADHTINIFRYHMSVFTIISQTGASIMKEMTDTMKSVLQKF